ncbi:MAG: TetR/AcrR family transcriptional regulator [Acidimicrobiales bacterium]|nr:TetR/AcrR family transcriptional regulator [Acidimicrobiales bacterium]
MTVDRAEARERVLAAAIDVVAGTGLRGLRMEEVAKAAGVSRATLYRYFPGGKDQLVNEAITWEVGRFFRELAVEVADAPDLRSRLERGLMFANRSMAGHAALATVLEADREQFLPRLHETSPLVVAVVRDYLAPAVAAERLRPGLDVDEAAEYLARMVLSFIPSPGRWDLDDPDEVARLVDQQFLAGIVEPGSRGVAPG